MIVISLLLRPEICAKPMPGIYFSIYWIFLLFLAD